MWNVREHRISFAALALLALGAAACEADGALDEASSLELGVNSAADSAMVEQIEAARLDLESRHFPVKIVSYAPASMLFSANVVDLAKDELIDRQAMVPEFDGVRPESFSLSTIGQRMDEFAANPDEELNVVGNIQQDVYPLLQPSQRIMDITWQTVDGTHFTSKAVYDQNGLVYDNMLSNIVLMEQVLAPDSEIAVPAASLVAAAGGAQRNVVYQRANWLGGKKRGECIIDHWVHWNSAGRYATQGTITSAWFSVGAASAQGRNVRLTSNYAEVATAWAWRTPTASFSISFNAARQKFSVSLGGVGSRAGGAGNYYFYH